MLLPVTTQYFHIFARGVSAVKHTVCLIQFLDEWVVAALVLPGGKKKQANDHFLSATIPITLFNQTCNRLQNNDSTQPSAVQTGEP